MLHAALHFTAHTRADIAGIDVAAAAAMPGVLAVFTAADLPGELLVGIIYKDWPVMIPVGGRTSYAGDVLAIVVAETRELARAAAAKIEVTYDVHPPVTDPVAALAARGPDRHVEHHHQRAEHQRVRPRRRRRGTRVARRTRCTRCSRPSAIEHAFLEPESTLAVPTGAGADRHLQVYSGGQGVWDDRDDIARVLAVGNDAVTVTLVSNGGAFGGKEDMSNQAHTAAGGVAARSCR